MGWILPPPPPNPLIVVNNIIYVFYEKLVHLENNQLLKRTPLSFMIVSFLKKAN
jgi:hypothetical protein